MRTASTTSDGAVVDLDRARVIRRLVRLHADLVAARGRHDDIVRALDDATVVLGELVRVCRSDEGLVADLGAARAMAGSYVLATLDLSDQPVSGDMLRRGRVRVLEELGSIIRRLGSSTP